MKQFFLALLALPLMAGAVVNPTVSKLSADELKRIDLSGKYSGKRHQYAYDHQSILQTFEYEFDLHQEGRTITGTSTIIKSNGDYADIKLRGTIVGDVLYFEEYEVVNQAKDPTMVWCFKSGGLNIRKSDGALKLVGATESFQADSHYPCTGGYTDLTKLDNSDLHLSAGTAKEDLGVANLQLSAFPNPFVDKTTISYQLTNDTKVTLEVFDINGRLLTTLEKNQNKTAGSYQLPLEVARLNASSGFAIIKLTAGSEVHSIEVVATR
ncbi:MAG: T9SS type A sorting domain-containing protein [Chitinophagales bacterium]